MNIERVNRVLNRAIVAFQESEIEAMSEAAIGYSIPSPKVKPMGKFERDLELAKEAIFLYFKKIGKKKPTKTVLKQLSGYGKVYNDFQEKMGDVPHVYLAAKELIKDLSGLKDYQREYDKLHKEQMSDYHKQGKEPKRKAGKRRQYTARQAQRSNAMDWRKERMELLRSRIIELGGKDPLFQ